MAPRLGDPFNLLASFNARAEGSFPQGHGRSAENGNTTGRHGCSPPRWLLLIVRLADGFAVWVSSGFDDDQIDLMAQHIHF